MSLPVTTLSRRPVPNGWLFTKLGATNHCQAGRLLLWGHRLVLSHRLSGPSLSGKWFFR
jgi:hypothetical protein